LDLLSIPQRLLAVFRLDSLRVIAQATALYRVISKDRSHVSSEFGDYVDDLGKVVKSNIDSRNDLQPPGTHFGGAGMPYCMHFNGGYAMHEGYVPRYAASHGCIRLPKGMAEHFFDASPEGTPVVVKE
jgi:L,D-transpeptidase catalytic domain